MTGGPSIRAVPFSKSTGGIAVRLLSDRHRRQLAAIATRMRVPARTILYREDSPLSWIFFNSEGVVKAFRELPSGKRSIAAFLFQGDIFGLAENGLYVNTTQAVTPVTVYRIPSDLLTDVLRRDPELEFHFLTKVTHELRKAQHRAIVLGRRDAAGRLATFLTMLEKGLLHKTGATSIPVPMSRTDIANYLGLSLEAVSRAARQLTREGIVEFEGRHIAHVVNRARFDTLVAAL
ncbi:MAG: Crp/Fnr family transcriptional regulator [Vicinamibacterales bacterium]